MRSHGRPLPCAAAGLQVPSTAAVTRPAGHFVGLCDGHTFCPMMR
jgi:hypothetical protein